VEHFYRHSAPYPGLRTMGFTRELRMGPLTWIDAPQSLSRTVLEDRRTL
jgi:hypothetical protein